jgi:hypothetical protein
VCNQGLLNVTGKVNRSEFMQIYARHKQSERGRVQRLQHHRRKCGTWVEEFSAHIEKPNADKVSIKCVGNFEGFLTGTVSCL